jgi:hypothetical protein
VKEREMGGCSRGKKLLCKRSRNRMSLVNHKEYLAVARVQAVEEVME